MNIFKYLNTGKFTPEEPFTNTYIKEAYDSEHARTDTKLLGVILYAKYEREDLHKVMETQCPHLTMKQRNALIKLLQILDKLFDGKLGACKTDPV